MKSKPNPRGTRPVAPPLTARYFDHPVARYNDNPLIRALRPLGDHIQLQQQLTKFPSHEGDAERDQPRAVKIARLQELFSSFYVGLPRVVELLEMLHTMICEGYVGRVPYSAEDQELRQRLYERQESGEFFDTDESDSGSEFAAALVGIPGIGKSKALKRVTAPYRKVIYHPELNIWQVPALLIELPYKGVSEKVLAHAIIRALDKLFPQANYYATYLDKRENSEVLFMDAVALMHTHYVGILLVDESQNQDYRQGAARKTSNPVRGQKPLTTLLLTATNESHIPMLMCGTPELRDVLGTRMSMLRRMVGRGMRTWKPLSLSQDPAVPGEFDVFLHLLEPFQWTKTPFELNGRMRDLFYHYTVGISDFIIKLFHDVQLRAIRNGGDEVVDEALVHSVAREELRAITDLTADMRKLKLDRISPVADLAAYMRLAPGEMDFDRQTDFSDGDDGPGEEPSDARDDDGSDTPEDAVEAPAEIPTGPAAKKPRKRRSSSASTPPPAPPEFTPVNNLDDALGD